MTKFDHEVLWELLRRGLPKGALLALKEPRPTKALEAAEAFCRPDSKPWLAMIGPAGCGKTVAAAYVCRDWLADIGWNNLATGDLEPICWLDARQLTTLGLFNADHDQWVARLERHRLLVVDDMGDEGSDLGRSQLLNVLYARHAKRRRTVITSNLKPGAFVERYGAPLGDRIRELAERPRLGEENSERAR